MQQVVAQLQEGFGQQPVAQISEEVFFSVPWGHHLYIISQCKDVDRAVFYLQKTVENGWSRYVVVELKIVDFMPEFIDKLNFYVSAADELLRGEGDNPSIGILLCKDKDSSVVEWSLRGITTPLGVASYQLQEVYERTLLEIKQEASEEE